MDLNTNEWAFDWNAYDQPAPNGDSTGLDWTLSNGLEEYSPNDPCPMGDAFMAAWREHDEEYKDYEPVPSGSISELDLNHTSNDSSSEAGSSVPTTSPTCKSAEDQEAAALQDSGLDCPSETRAEIIRSLPLYLQNPQTTSDKVHAHYFFTVQLLVQHVRLLEAQNSAVALVLTESREGLRLANERVKELSERIESQDVEKLKDMLNVATHLAGFAGFGDEEGVDLPRLV